MTLDIATIWTSIIIPIVIGPIFIFFKTMYDNFTNKNDQRKLLKFNDHVDRIRTKLQKFYWPIYLKLICVYQMNFNIPIPNNEYDYNSSGSSTSQESNDESSEPFIKFTKKKLRKCQGYYTKSKKNPNVVKCKRFIPNNSTKLCRRCQWYKNNNQNKNDDDNNDRELSPIPIPTPIPMPINTNTNTNTKNSIKITIPNDISTDESLSFTGNGVGIVQNLPTLSLEINQETIGLLKSLINSSNKEIVNIIENNISLAEPNSKLGKQLVKFIKYSKIRTLIKESHGDNLVSQFGAKDNTNKLLSLIELKLFDLQKEYHIFMRRGPYESFSSSDSDNEEN